MFLAFRSLKRTFKAVASRVRKKSHWLVEQALVEAHPAALTDPDGKEPVGLIGGEGEAEPFLEQPVSEAWGSLDAEGASGRSLRRHRRGPQPKLD